MCLDARMFGAWGRVRRRRLRQHYPYRTWTPVSISSTRPTCIRRVIGDRRRQSSCRGRSSASNFDACRRIVSFASSSPIRLRAARSSAESLVVRSASSPRSMRVGGIHRYFLEPGVRHRPVRRRCGAAKSKSPIQDIAGRLGLVGACPTTPAGSRCRQRAPAPVDSVILR